MIDEPADTPVTTPVVELMVAAPPVPLHVPPGDASVSVVVAPMHTTGDPEIGDGNGLTVTVL